MRTSLCPISHQKLLGNLLRQSLTKTVPLLQKNDPNICAVASDTRLRNIEVPVFDLDDIKTISEFIMRNTGLLETL